MAWTKHGNLRGPQGPAAPGIAAGSGAPNQQLPEGWLYIDATTGELYVTDGAQGTTGS